MGRHRRRDIEEPEEDEEELDEEEDIDFVLFQGALNGVEANLKENAKLVRAGLMPAKQLVTEALARRAELIRMEPKGNASVVRFMIDGVAYPGSRMPKQQGLAVTQMIKLLSGLDVRDRGNPQSGGVKAELDETPYELKVDTVPLGQGAERLTIRARNLKFKLDKPQEIGIPEELRLKIRELTGERQGVFLGCGPPGSGVTITTHGVLRSVDSFMYSIFSTGDLTGRDDVHITPFKPNEGESFEDQVTRMQRVEADILFVDPIRDADTALQYFTHCDKLAIIGEMQSQDAAHCLVELIEWMGDPQIVAKGLRAIISGKLIRVLCDDCKEAYRPHPKLLAKLGLPPETKTLYRHGRPPDPPDPEDEEEDDGFEYQPCRKCSGVGFYGRTGIFEMLEVTEPMKELIASQPFPKDIRALAKDEDMETFQKAGLRLVAQGRTSLEELQRVFKK